MYVVHNIPIIRKYVVRTVDKYRVSHEGKKTTLTVFSLSTYVLHKELSEASGRCSNLNNRFLWPRTDLSLPSPYTYYLPTTSVNLVHWQVLLQLGGGCGSPLSLNILFLLRSLSGLKKSTSSI